MNGCEPHLGRVVGEGLAGFLGETGADELIVSMPIHSIEARLKSVDLFAGLSGLMKPAA